MQRKTTRAIWGKVNIPFSLRSVFAFPEREESNLLWNLGPCSGLSPATKSETALKIFFCFILKV